MNYFYLMKKFMKKLITSFFVLLILVSFWFASSQLEEAISWMHNNGLTKFDNSTDFMADKTLRRDEATKFFWQYAITIQKSVADETKIECNNFNDINEWWEDLKNNMQNTCKLWLFRGSQWKFMPKGTLTNGQAITVLIRMIDWFKDESQWHFAQKYYEKAKELGILEWLNISPVTFDSLITRWNVSKLLYNTFNLKWTKLSNQDLKNIDGKATKLININDVTWNKISTTDTLSLTTEPVQQGVIANTKTTSEVLSDGTQVYKNSVCDHVYYLWPKWWCYYINWNNSKIYDTTKKCCSNL